MHLAVAPGDFAVRVDDHGGVVIDACRAPLEDRRDDRNLVRGGDGRERLGRRSGNFLRQVEEADVLDWHG